MRFIIIIGLSLFFSLATYSQSDSIMTIDLQSYFNPQSVQLSFNKGIDFYAVKQYDQALSEFNKSLEIDPNNYSAFLNSLKCARKIDKGVLLKQIQMINTVPPNDELYYITAIFAFEAGFYKNAKELFDLAIEINPDKAEYYNARAVLYGEMDYVQASINDYNTVISLDSTDEKAFFDRASILLKHGQHQLALKDLQRALELKPNSDDVMLELANIHYLLKDFDQSLFFLDKLGDHTDVNRISNLRSLAFMEKGQYKKAMEEVELLVADNRADYIVLNSAANYSNHLDLFYQAMANYNKAIEKNDQLGLLYLNRGIIYELIRDNNSACNDWRKAESMGVEQSKQYLKEKCK